MLSLWFSIPYVLSSHSEPPLHASFPSVHAFVMLEGTMNLTGETQPLVEQLMMIKRMQVRVFTEQEMVLVSPQHILMNQFLLFLLKLHLKFAVG